MIVYPNYYPEFQCIASRCRHSCCIGWEIDIDPETAEYYAEIEGKLGEKLRANIAGGEEAHFCLGAEERCPFLTGENLCESIRASVIFLPGARRWASAFAVKRRRGC